ncbi:TPA: terminase, partial [Escherichia coli]
VADNLPQILADYLMESTGNVPDKLQLNKDK